jgi:hypothetical protein
MIYVANSSEQATIFGNENVVPYRNFIVTDDYYWIIQVPGREVRINVRPIQKAHQRELTNVAN